MLLCWNCRFSGSGVVGYLYTCTLMSRSTCVQWYSNHSEARQAPIYSWKELSWESLLQV